MSHTNSTPNYALPQFITTDKPAWLTDINGAFSAIDTGIDAAKDAADAAQGDATQALTDAGNAGTTATNADTKASGAVASIADTFSSTNTYAAGDYVMYNSLLYKCINAVTTPGAWTGSANWDRETVEGAIQASANTLNSQIATKANANNVYTISQTDGLLAAKLDSNYHVSTGSGTFAGLLNTPDRVWLIVAQRLSTNSSLVLIAHKQGTSFLFKEVVKDTGMTYTYNQDNGSVVVMYGGSTAGVYGGAYRLA